MSSAGARDERSARIERLLRRGPLRADAFTSPTHDSRVAAVLGIALGVAFTTCFVTGWISHLIQHPAPWFWWPTTPAWGYRLTQGVHVATGIASIPLLLAKLWVVYDRLWAWPPVRGVAHAIERLMLLPLIAGSLFLLLTGVVNITNWYTLYPFGFIQGHWAAAWITIGALIVHIGAKLPVTRQALARFRAGEPLDEPAASDEAHLLSRRQLLAGAFGSAGLLTLLTIGQSIPVLSPLSWLAVRTPRRGPQGLAVNRSAAAAGVEFLVDQVDSWRLVVNGDVDQPLELSLADLQAMPQREAILPIACVEGWSFSASWRGVPLRDLLAMAGAPPGARLDAQSVEESGCCNRSDVTALVADDPDTLIALEVNGEPLHIEHGFPARLIGPNRPGVMNTKWLARLEVTA